jgi:hypothetical protein
MAQGPTTLKRRPGAFSLVQDFSPVSNPNGAWSYGHTSTLGGTFQLYPAGGGDCNVEFCGWGAGPTYLDQPTVLSNDYLKLIGTVELQPSGDGEYSVVRWTAPASAKFDVVGVFVGDRDCTSTDVHVLYNNKPIYNDRIICLFDPSLFHFAAKLNKGDTLDYVVGNDSSSNDDATGLDITIEPVQ